MDPLNGFRWADHWRRLVEERAAQTDGDGGAGKRPFWNTGRAAAMATRSEERDPVLDVIRPWLTPQSTVIDVGAGTGRLSAPLADETDWVTAVEPAQAMRERIPARPNLTVVAADWLDAEVAPADLVLCAHVLYPLAEPVPFIEKLQAMAKERVVIVMRDGPNPHPAESLVEGRIREPTLTDCFCLLREMGILAEVSRWRRTQRLAWESAEAAAEDCQGRCGVLWDGGSSLLQLEQMLIRGEDQSVSTEPTEVPLGALHWQPWS